MRRPPPARHVPPGSSWVCCFPGVLRPPLFAHITAIRPSYSWHLPGRIEGAMTIRSYLDVTRVITDHCVRIRRRIGGAYRRYGHRARQPIWPLCVIRGNVNRLCIGARTNIQVGRVIHVTHRHAALPAGNATTIGSEVTTGHQATLHGCTIEDRRLTGTGSVVRDGVVIRSHVLLEARSLVIRRERARRRLSVVRDSCAPGPAADRSGSCVDQLFGCPLCPAEEQLPPGGIPSADLAGRLGRGAPNNSG